jgi:hypothetical protein
MIKEIRAYLIKIENIRGKTNKIPVVEEMYAYMIENSWFVHDHPKFKEAVWKKLNDLINQGYPVHLLKKTVESLYPDREFPDGEFPGKCECTCRIL